MKLVVPRFLTVQSVCEWSQELTTVPEHGEYVIDFGPERFITPYSMMLLACAIRAFIAAHPNSNVASINHENHGYASYMGFFKMMGLEHGNAPDSVAGRPNYIPVRKIDVAEIRRAAAESFDRAVGDIIEDRAGDLARILAGEHAGDLVDTLQFSIREIMRNVVEHSQAEEIYFCAQCFPQRHEVEVCIMDYGIGIHAALTSNPDHEDLSQKEAVEMALMPGISGNPLAGRLDNVWANSGYGLYMTSRICRSGGKFTVCSAGHGLQLDRNGKLNFLSDFKGTAIQLLIDTGNIQNLRDRLAQFRDEGRVAAQALAGANNNYASTASQMLRRDFVFEQDL